MVGEGHSSAPYDMELPPDPKIQALRPSCVRLMLFLSKDVSSQEDLRNIEGAVETLAECLEDLDAKAAMHFDEFILLSALRTLDLVELPRKRLAGSLRCCEKAFRAISKLNGKLPYHYLCASPDRFFALADRCLLYLASEEAPGGQRSGGIEACMYECLACLDSALNGGITHSISYSKQRDAHEELDLAPQVNSTQAQQGPRSGQSLELTIALCRRERRPFVGHLISVLLGIAKGNRDKVQALKALNVLGCIVECMGRCPGKRASNSHESPEDTLACFFPGISSTLAKVATGDYKQGSAVVAAALRQWARVIEYTFPCRSVACPETRGCTGAATSLSEQQTQGDFSLGHNVDESVLPTVVRNEQWKTSTDEKLSRLISQVAQFALRHASCEVRKGLLDIGLALAYVHMDDLPLSSSVCLEIVVVAAEDESTVVGHKAKLFLSRMLQDSSSEDRTKIENWLIHRFLTTIESLPAITTGRTPPSPLSILSGNVKTVGYSVAFKMILGCLELLKSKVRNAVEINLPMIIDSLCTVAELEADEFDALEVQTWRCPNAVGPGMMEVSHGSNPTKLTDRLQVASLNQEGARTFVCLAYRKRFKNLSFASDDKLMERLLSAIGRECNMRSLLADVRMILLPSRLNLTRHPHHPHHAHHSSYSHPHHVEGTLFDAQSVQDEYFDHHSGASSNLLSQRRANPQRSSSRSEDVCRTATLLYVINQMLIGVGNLAAEGTDGSVVDGAQSHFVNESHKLDPPTGEALRSHCGSSPSLCMTMADLFMSLPYWETGSAFSSNKSSLLEREEPYESLPEFRMRVITSQLIVEGIGHIFGILAFMRQSGSKDLRKTVDSVVRQLLVVVLYPLLEQNASPIKSISQAAESTLVRLSLYVGTHEIIEASSRSRKVEELGKKEDGGQASPDLREEVAFTQGVSPRVQPSNISYPAISALLVENLDHLVNALCHCLKDPVGHPNTPAVVAGLLRYVRAAEACKTDCGSLEKVQIGDPIGLVLLEEITMCVAEALDESWAEELVVPQLLSSLASITSYLVHRRACGDESALKHIDGAMHEDEMIRSPFDSSGSFSQSGETVISASLPRRDVSALKAFIGRMKKLQQLDAETQLERKILGAGMNAQSPVDWSAVNFAEDVEGSDSPSVADESDTQQDPEAGPKTLDQKISIAVLDRCQYFIVSSIPQIQLEALRCAENSLRILRGHDDVLLPQVHRIWPSLCEAMRSSLPTVVTQALHILQLLSSCCSDFISQRFSTDAWPLLRSVLRRKASEAKVSTPPTMSMVQQIFIARASQERAGGPRNVSLLEDSDDEDEPSEARAHASSPQVALPKSAIDLLTKCHTPDESVRLSIQRLRQHALRFVGLQLEKELIQPHVWDIGCSSLAVLLDRYKDSCRSHSKRHPTGTSEFPMQSTLAETRNLVKDVLERLLRIEPDTIYFLIMSFCPNDRECSDVNQLIEVDGFSGATKPCMWVRAYTMAMDPQAVCSLGEHSLSRPLQASLQSVAAARTPRAPFVAVDEGVRRLLEVTEISRSAHSEISSAMWSILRKL